jgi:hypothetical protein
MSAAGFVSARELSRAFYGEVVRPLLAGRTHAAALLGWGSDVLGYDTARSTDHGWGPRLLVFVADREVVEEVVPRLDRALPETFRGWPVRYGWDEVPVAHRVTVATLPAWLVEFLGVDATAGMSDLDWLLTPQQRLLGVVAGPVYADDDGALERVRRSLAWYPEPVWRRILACQWHRLAQEEALVARTAEVEDETGVTCRTRSGSAPRSRAAGTTIGCPTTSARRSTHPTSWAAKPPSAGRTRRSRGGTTTRASPPRSTRRRATTTVGRHAC